MIAAVDTAVIAGAFAALAVARLLSWAQRHGFIVIDEPRTPEN